MDLLTAAYEADMPLTELMYPFYAWCEITKHKKLKGHNLLSFKTVCVIFWSYGCINTKLIMIILNLTNGFKLLGLEWLRNFCILS